MYEKEVNLLLKLIQILYLLKIKINDILRLMIRNTTVSLFSLAYSS